MSAYATVSTALVVLLATICNANFLPASFRGFTASGFEVCNETINFPALDMVKFSGLWYESLRAPYPTELLSRCTTANATYNGDENELTVQVRTHRFGGIEQYQGVSYPDIDTPAKLFVKWSFPPQPQLPFFILDTDYSNYMVAYACFEEKIFGRVIAKQKFAWIATRTTSSTIDTAKATQVLSAVGVDINRLQQVIQTIC